MGHITVRVVNCIFCEVKLGEFGIDENYILSHFRYWSIKTTNGIPTLWACREKQYTAFQVAFNKFIFSTVLYFHIYIETGCVVFKIC